MQLFDSHAHYDDSRFEEEYEGGADKAIADANSLGIIGIINAGTCIKNTLSSIALAEKYDFVYATSGYHPCDCQYVDDTEVLDALDKTEQLAAHPKVVAIGEIGLDYHYDDTDKARQKLFFDAQLSIAEKLDLPVVIHDRDAHGDSMDMIKAHPKARGVFHSYSGSAEMARQLVDLGWYISFSGPISYKNSGKLHEVAAIVPEERILIETDSPYLPPVPHRGKLNYSGYMFHTLNALAAARGANPEKIAEVTINNTKRLFGIK